MREVMRELENFVATASDDPLKRDLELVCTKCKEVVCDIEDGDGLHILVGVAQDHIAVCEGKPSSPDESEEA